MIAPAVLPLFAMLVAPPTGSDDGCPSARQVSEAMAARFPALLVALDASQASTRPDVLRAVLDVAADGTVVRFSLVDSRGETQLRRTLAAPTHGRSATECLALADTLAAIVERYLGGIVSSDAPDWRATDSPLAPPPIAVPDPAIVPASQPARRAAFVLLGLGWRMPTGARPSDGEVEARLGAEVEVTSSSPRLAGLITIGAAPALTGSGLDERRTTTLRRFPARLGASLKMPAGPGWVEPTLAVAVDLLAVSSTAGASSRGSQTFRLGPGVEVGVGYQLKIGGIFHLRPRATLGFAIRRYDVAVEAAPDAVVLGTPRAYASFGIDTGVLFQ